MADRLAGRATPLAATQRFGHRRDTPARLARLGVRVVAHRRMQCGALLADVDLLAREHRGDPCRQPGVARVLAQARERFGEEAFLRQIGAKPLRLEGQPRDTLGVLTERSCIDDGIVGIVVDVDDGREIDLDADGARLLTDHACDIMRVFISPLH